MEHVFTERTYKRILKRSASELHVQIQTIGADVLITVWGGDKPHIGSVVMADYEAVPAGSDISVSSSVINIPGHKDDVICRILAEAAAYAKNTVAVCCGGFHIDNITSAQIAEVIESVRSIAEEIASS